MYVEILYEHYVTILINKVYHLINQHIILDHYQMIFKNRQSHLLFKLRHKCFNVSEDDLIGIMIYIDRLSEIDPNKFLTETNISYILLATIILYFKMYDDCWYTNSFYAEWTRLDLSILNQTEKDIFDNISLFIEHLEFSHKRDDLFSGLII